MRVFAFAMQVPADPADGNDKWVGAVAALGKIFMLPYSAASVLVLDPVRHTVDTSIKVSTRALKWEGGVLAPNGKIYCMPFNADTVPPPPRAPPTAAVASTAP